MSQDEGTSLMVRVPAASLTNGQNLMLVDARILQEFRAVTRDRGLIASQEELKDLRV
jgi:hypothetical protein